MIYYKFRKSGKKIFLAALMYLAFFSANLLYDSIPDELYLTNGEEIHFSFPITFEKVEKEVAVFQNNAKRRTALSTERDYHLSFKLLNLIPIKEVTVHIIEKSYVMPSGAPIGIYAKTKGVLIIGTGKVTSENGLNYEPASQLIRSGDYIVAVNGDTITQKERLIEKVNASQGEPLILSIVREGEEIELKLTPVKMENGTYKLGIWVRDDLAGIGTLTYVKENLDYGALGHPVSDADTGEFISLLEGKIYRTDIVGIVKGKNGEPGELTGVINYNQDYCLGSIMQNTVAGIRGHLDYLPKELETPYLEVAMKHNIKLGEAYVLSAFDGQVKEYEIEIDEIDFNKKEENKGIIFQVKDERLLHATGGIVQGMSGSPIVQNGRIVGAVTHVLVNDPTRGYGVFIENMLEYN